MDRVRFGKALGVGTREAGKALWKAADAAIAPDPGAARAANDRGRVAGEKVRESVVQARSTTAGVKRGGKRFGEAVWGPVAKASGVLWLEVTGVFFGLFALTAAIEVWKRHGDFRTPGDGRQHAWFALAMLVVFGWFTVSSFLRASKRSRR
jgi:hypothetical protein